MSFGDGDGDGEDEDFVEELDLDSMHWFAGEHGEHAPVRHAIALHRDEALPRPGRTGEVEGEVEVGPSVRVRFRVRWQLG